MCNKQRNIIDEEGESVEKDSICGTKVQDLLKAEIGIQTQRETQPQEKLEAYSIPKINCYHRGTWVVLSVKHPAVDFCSGHDL